MITHSDDGPDFEPDDPLAVILRPADDYFGAPPGRYEAIRRGALRRRLLRVAAGVGLSCAVAALVALPLHLTTDRAPASPAAPPAPPPASSPTAVSGPPTAPTRPPTPEAVTPRPTEEAPTDSPAPLIDPAVPSPTGPPPTSTSTSTSAARESAYPIPTSGARR
ncbi:hypothetical protein ACFO3J_12900 [Streptomyces polygonati]|uniref:Cellulase n=1 Tax=Streptomyces polygonati TaxID=1617087 RepID=A0ABV8HJZ7_9ACTN